MSLAEGNRVLLGGVQTGARRQSSRLVGGGATFTLAHLSLGCAPLHHTLTSARELDGREKEVGSRRRSLCTEVIEKRASRKHIVSSR